jgi:hypothetical protein
LHGMQEVVGSTPIFSTALEGLQKCGPFLLELITLYPRVSASISLLHVCVCVVLRLHYHSHLLVP